MDADAIVIGAGAAGLAAARALAARSLRVILVEARDRVGGRVWSHASARATVAVELGAEFIHGPARETMALLRDAGTAAVDTGYESWVCTKDGKLQRDDYDFRSAACIFEAAEKLERDESVDQFLRRFQTDVTMREPVDVARSFVEGFEAADPAIASVLSIADEWRSGVDFAIARPLGGYHPLIERLSAECAAAGVWTYLSTAVRRILWRRGSVDIEARSSDGESRTLRARAAIVTLPAGVLRHSGDETEVKFEPDLPEVKRDALRNIEMGHVVRVGLLFRSAFWEKLHDGRYHDSGFFRCVRGPFHAFWTQLPVRSELIVAWAGGPQATALSGASREELIKRALDGFADLFGAPALAREEFEEGVMHDWSRDPYARGAYSYLIVGGRNARRMLAEPVENTLFFAGEATSADGQGGTVNGALETGDRAAQELAASLKGRLAK
jgi:monoamine oxidase